MISITIRFHSRLVKNLLLMYNTTMSKKEQITNELHKVLQSMGLKDYDNYINENDITGDQTLQSYFEEYMASHGLNKKDLVKNSLLDRTYGYQILSGLRQPSRDKILALCLSAGMSFHEIQRALEIAKEGILYPKDPRDAAIILCIHNQLYKLNDVNMYLDQKGFDPIR